MDALWKAFERLFNQLSDPLKLIVVLALIAVLVFVLLAYLLSRRRSRRLTKEVRRTKYALRKVAEERDQLQRRIDAMGQVDAHVWKRPVAPGHYEFVDRNHRQTRFIAFCNLKGGVGKTTLTVNVGVGLALLGRRVLLLDLDFQGTLSNQLLRSELLKEYRDRGWTTDALLNPDASLDRIREYAFPVEHSPTSRVMISREALEIAEFAQQARFFVNPQNDVRFHLQRLLHTPAVFQEYDYVLFDCPPRMTTSCINALTCSDYVVLPTSLSQLDIEAVRRTLTWLRELRQVTRAEFLGVVVSRCKMRLNQLIQFEQGQLKSLEQFLGVDLPGKGHVFDVKIPDSPIIARSSAEKRPAVLDGAEGRRWFESLCRELERRCQR